MDQSTSKSLYFPSDSLAGGVAVLGFASATNMIPGPLSGVMSVLSAVLEIIENDKLNQMLHHELVERVMSILALLHGYLERSGTTEFPSHMAHHLESFYLHLKGIEGYLRRLTKMNGIQRILHQSSIKFRIDQLARRLEDLRSTWIMMLGMETHRVLSGIKEEMSQQSPHSSLRNRSGLLVVHEDEMYIQKRLNSRHRGWFSGAAVASVNGVDRLVKTYNMSSTNQDFLAELRRLRQFRHPNLPQVFAVSDDQSPAAFIVFHQAVQSRDISTLINFFWRTENKFVITMMTLRLILDLKIVANYLLDSGLVDMQELGSVLLPQNLWLDTNGTLLLGDATTKRPRDPSRIPSKGQNVAQNVSNFIYDVTPEIIGISLRPLNPHGLPRLEPRNERLSRSLVLRDLSTDPSELSQVLDLPPRLGDIASSVNDNSYNSNALEAYIASITERSHTGQFDCDGQWMPGDILCLSEKGDALKRVGRLPSRRDPSKAISIREDRSPQPRVYGVFENSPHAPRNNLPNGLTRYRFAHVGSDVKVISLGALRRIGITHPQEIWSSFRSFAVSLAAAIDVPQDRLILVVSTQDQVRFAQYGFDRLDDAENKPPESLYLFVPSDPAVMPVWSLELDPPKSVKTEYNCDMSSAGRGTVRAIKQKCYYIQLEGDTQTLSSSIGKH